jgi:hypothetical protein
VISLAVAAAGWVGLVHPEITPHSNFHHLRDTTGARIAASVMQSDYSMATDFHDPTDMRDTSSFYDVETDITVEDAVIWAGQYQCDVVLFLHDRACADFDSDLALVQIEATYSALRQAQGLPVFGYLPGAMNAFRPAKQLRGLL